MNKDCICYWDWQSTTTVIDSRAGLERPGMKRRRRQCLHCNRRLTTLELTVEHLELIEKQRYELTPADLMAIETLRAEYLQALVTPPAKKKRRRAVK